MTPLEELLETLDDATPHDDPPFLVAAFGSPRTGNGVLGINEDISHLFGWRVPHECWAVGLVGGGTQLHLRQLGVPGLGPAGDDGPADGLRLCCLVGREGDVATALRSEGGGLVASGEAEGRMVDALRRVLGLPTPGPECGTADLLAVLWIQDLLAAAQRGEDLGWPAAGAFHPAMKALAQERHDIGVEHIEMVARVATTAWTWEHLRRQACEDGRLAQLVPARVADWMDEGMFARWVMAGVPPLADACCALADAVRPQVWHAVHEVIKATGAGGAGPSGVAVRPPQGRASVPPFRR